jgi:hypothetical protein
MTTVCKAQEWMSLLKKARRRRWRRRGRKGERQQRIAQLSICNIMLIKLEQPRMGYKAAKMLLGPCREGGDVAHLPLLPNTF